MYDARSDMPSVDRMYRLLVRSAVKKASTHTMQPTTIISRTRTMYVNVRRATRMPCAPWSNSRPDFAAMPFTPCLPPGPPDAAGRRYYDSIFPPVKQMNRL